mmetsp:Transcript_9805/g.29995  ORF Transcript_9805/g.29995 Transcript_9805/m.29995 type:complete len:225 (-) Transcript_9805:1365-2039(-)
MSSARVSTRCSVLSNATCTWRRHSQLTTDSRNGSTFTKDMSSPGRRGLGCLLVRKSRRRCGRGKSTLSLVLASCGGGSRRPALVLVAGDVACQKLPVQNADACSTTDAAPSAWSLRTPAPRALVRRRTGRSTSAPLPLTSLLNVNSVGVTGARRRPKIERLRALRKKLCDAPRLRAAINRLTGRKSPEWSASARSSKRPSSRRSVGVVSKKREKGQPPNVSSFS